MLNIKFRKSWLFSCRCINADNFQWPTSHKESEEILKFFCDNLLEHFGTYQDSLYSGHKYLFHSRLSFATNSKMISPKEVIDQVIEKFQKNQNKIEISHIEGFVRLILGWCEYMRGIYWKEMPDYKDKNALNNTGKLPDYFWSGKTKMKCMQHALSQSLDSAYAYSAIDGDWKFLPAYSNASRPSGRMVSWRLYRCYRMG